MNNKQKILRAVGLLGVLILLTASMLQTKRPPVRAIMFVPDATGCQITYPAGTHPTPDSIPKGTLLSAECLVAR